MAGSADFEKLGQFYLGREYDLDAGARGEGLTLYDSKDLVTHAVCVGMTGSGKTGLCVGLLEEAAIDGIPAIVVDPKGDLSNLLLTFPELRAADFEPWVNADDAKKKGMDIGAFAEQQAQLWKKGLADWGQDGERIRRLKNAAEFEVYTPGSGAGRRVSILRSFDPPEATIVDDAELFGERVASTVTSVLGLIGMEADPMQSREHILLSALLAHAWKSGTSVNLAGLIEAVQRPPMQRVGVMEVESFFPSKERFALAMALNALVASPGFAAWSEGEALDIQRMLFGASGKPRVSVFSIAHLGDAERMFFVSMLMNAVLGWTRRQSGTSSLRAIVYMDEIAGYVPPVSNPPSKRPMLTLMKQGRAFGVGVVLATQNPVDLDYKGLSNAGTWFIGRLQTERDKERVLDGLEGAMAAASAKFDRSTIDTMLSRLGSRVFLMNNIHDDAPSVFQTRWTLSYLRGPMTREQLKRLTGPREPEKIALGSSESRSAEPAASHRGGTRPVIAPGVQQYFVPARRIAPGLEYRPMLMGSARVYYSDAKLEESAEESVCLLCPIVNGPVPADWEHAVEARLSERELQPDPAAGATFAALPPEATQAKNYEKWKKDFVNAVYRTHTLELFTSAELHMTSEPLETEGSFRARLAHAAREERDAMAEALRRKYAPKLATLQDRIRRAEQAVEVQRQQASTAKVSTALSFGAAIMSAFIGRRAANLGTLGRATTAARGVSRSAKEAADVDRAQENVAALQQQMHDLDVQFQEELAELTMRLDPAEHQIETITLKPKKTNITVRAVVLAWAPYQSGSPAWA